MSGAGWVAATVALTVYGQLVVKWRVDLSSQPAGGGWRRQLAAASRLLLDPWVVSGFAAALLAGLAWFAALSELDLSTAYPFTAASFVAVMLLSAVFFAERITAPKAVGTALIAAGIAITPL